MKVNVWIIDDRKDNYELVLTSFPSNSKEYCDFYYFDKGIEAINTLKKGLEQEEYTLLPDIVFVDYYLEDDEWRGDKITKLIIELYKRYSQKQLKPHIIAFSSIDRKNEEMLDVGATEGITKVEINGVCNEIVNNFYDKDAILTFRKPRFTYEI